MINIAENIKIIAAGNIVDFEIVKIIFVNDYSWAGS